MTRIRICVYGHRMQNRILAQNYKDSYESMQIRIRNSTEIHTLYSLKIVEALPEYPPIGPWPHPGWPCGLNIPGFPYAKRKMGQFEVKTLYKPTNTKKQA
jgi:hypothetical protein